MTKNDKNFISNAYREVQESKEEIWNLLKETSKEVHKEEGYSNCDFYYLLKDYEIKHGTNRMERIKERYFQLYGQENILASIMSNTSY